MSAVLFFVLSALAILSAFIAATAPKIVHAAFGLFGTFVGVAGLYVLLGADFIALAQVLVYAGGILILLVFGVLMTANAPTALGLDVRPARLWPVLLGGLLLLGMLAAIHATEWPAGDPVADPAPTTAAIGRALLDPDRYLVPFEVASVLLLAALVGAAYLARRRREP